MYAKLSLARGGLSNKPVYDNRHAAVSISLKFQRNFGTLSVDLLIDFLLYPVYV